MKDEFPWLVIAVMAAVVFGVIKHDRIEDAKFLRFVEEHKCQVYKYDRKTGKYIWKCNHGVEIQRP